MPYKNKDDLRTYQRNWMRKRREEYFKGKVCVNCGSSNNLELHHIDPDKKFTHKIWSYNSQIREVELAKCIPLCHDCHLEETKSYLSKLYTGKIKQSHGEATRLESVAT